MSPTLKLLTKRLNAYNIYLKRDVSNYIPTEMLRSSDLSNISAMLHRSATIGITTSAESYAYTTNNTNTPTVATATTAGSCNMEGSSIDNPIGRTGSPERVNLRSETGPVGSPERVNLGVNTETRSPSVNSQNMLVALTSPLSSYMPAPDSYGYDRENDYFDADYYDTELNECMVEIRLTSKHYALCVQEDFIPEAMRSLKRRWWVAKRMWNLILLQQQYKRLIEETAQKEQEERMIELLKAPDYTQYDQDGQPLLLLNEEYSREDEEYALQLQSGLGECSDIAVNSNLPHAKYLPAAASVVSSTSTALDSIHNSSSGSSSSNSIDKEKHIENNSNSIENTKEQHHHQQQQQQENREEAEEGEEQDDDDESSVHSQPAVTLERILLAYSAQQVAHAEAERNPDPENRSSDTLKRPTDYDSIGEGLLLYSVVL